MANKLIGLLGECLIMPIHLEQLGPGFVASIDGLDLREGLIRQCWQQNQDQVVLDGSALLGTPQADQLIY